MNGPFLSVRPLRPAWLNFYPEFTGPFIFCPSALWHPHLVTPESEALHRVTAFYTCGPHRSLVNAEAHHLHNLEYRITSITRPTIASSLVLFLSKVHRAFHFARVHDVSTFAYSSWSTVAQGHRILHMWTIRILIECRANHLHNLE
jgi:hypothetical protein